MNSEGGGRGAGRGAKGALAGPCGLIDGFGSGLSEGFGSGFIEGFGAGFIGIFYYINTPQISILSDDFIA